MARASSRASPASERSIRPTLRATRTQQFRNNNNNRPLSSPCPSFADRAGFANFADYRLLRRRCTCLKLLSVAGDGKAMDRTPGEQDRLAITRCGNAAFSVNDKRYVIEDICLRAGATCGGIRYWLRRCSHARKKKASAVWGGVRLSRP